MQANPLWPVNARFPRLKEDLSVDVAVVGGGAAGISCAYQLNKAGYKVALLEQDEVGNAATGASSGVLYYGSGTNFVPATKFFGRERAVHLWKETSDSIDEIVLTAEKDSIPCGIRRCGAIMVAKTEAENHELEKESSHLGSSGIKTKIISNDEIKAFFSRSNFLAGLTFDAVGQVHPALFFSGLAKTSDLRVYENSPAQSWEETANGVIVKTPLAKVACSKLLLATNHQNYFGLDTHFEIESSVILASQPQTDLEKIWPLEKIIWSMDEKYDIIYQRDGRAILELYQLGNEERKLSYYYPGVNFNIEQQWGDIWAKTMDWLPIVGKVSPHIGVVVGMGDQGIVMSWTSSKHIVNALEEKNDWFLDMTSPKRFSDP